MFRPTFEAQNGSGGSRDAKHHQYASDEIHCTTSVGLTRIELVTSSLSGMRFAEVLHSLETLTSLDLEHQFIGGVSRKDRLCFCGNCSYSYTKITLRDSPWLARLVGCEAKLRQLLFASFNPLINWN